MLNGKRLGLVVILALGCSIAVHAKSAKKEAKATQAEAKKPPMAKRTANGQDVGIPRLVTYSQLMKLPTPVRTRYLQAVAQALINLETMQNSVLEAAPKHAMIDAMRDLLAKFEFVSSAKAEDRPMPRPKVGGVGEPVLLQNSSGKWSWTCVGSLGGAKIEIEPHLNVCVAPVEKTATSCPNPRFTLRRIKMYRGKIWAFGEADQADDAVAEAFCVANESLAGMQYRFRDPNVFEVPHSPASEVDAKTVKEYNSRPEAVSALLAKSDILQNSFVNKIAAASPPSGALPGISSQSTTTNIVGKWANARTRVPEAANVVPFIVDGAWQCGIATNGSFAVSPNYRFEEALGTCATNRACQSQGEGITINYRGSAQPALVGTTYCVPLDSFAVMSDPAKAQMCPGMTQATLNSYTNNYTPLNCAPISVSYIAAGDISLGAKTRVIGGVPATTQTQLLTVSTGNSLGNVPNPSGGGACELPRLECPYDPKSSADKQFFDFFKENTAIANQGFAGCIYGGNFSTYIEHRPAKNRCTPPKPVGKAKACGSGKIMCSPLVFGVTSEGKLLCATNNGEATANCKRALEDQGGYTAADPSLFGSDNAAQEAWTQFTTDFVASFRAYCKRDSTLVEYTQLFQNKFCKQCNDILDGIEAQNPEIYSSIAQCPGALATDSDINQLPGYKAQ